MGEAGLGQGKEETEMGQIGHVCKTNCWVLLNPHKFSLFSWNWTENFSLLTMF